MPKPRKWKFRDFSLLFYDTVDEGSILFSKNTQKWNFMKIRPERAELLHEDRQTDGRRERTLLIVAFRNFAKKNLKINYPYKILLHLHDSYHCQLNRAIYLERIL